MQSTPDTQRITPQLRWQLDKYKQTGEAFGTRPTKPSPMNPKVNSPDATHGCREALGLRTLRLMLAFIWALMLALSGVWLWLNRSELAQMLPVGDQALVVACAAISLAGAQFVFMQLVADDLCPNTPAGLKMFIKTFTGSIIWMSLLWMVLQVWR